MLIHSKTKSADARDPAQQDVSGRTVAEVQHSRVRKIFSR